jgi:lysozyme
MATLNDDSKAILNQQLRVDEGCVLHVYKDSLGLNTIGIGRCLDTKGLTTLECDYLNLGVYSKQEVIDSLKERGVSQDEADQLLSNDIDFFTTELFDSLSWLEDEPEMVKIILINMTFNLGVNGLLGFHTTLSLIQNGNYTEAAKQMLNSKWAIQVGDRADRLSNLLANC